MTAPARTPSFVCCSAEVSACLCCLEAGHDGPHVCDCGGSWRLVNGDVQVIEWPGPVGMRRDRSIGNTVEP